MAEQKNAGTPDNEKGQQTSQKNTGNDQAADVSMSQTEDVNSYDVTTGRTERINSEEHQSGNESTETDMLREKTADSTGAHQEGQYDKNNSNA